jgi:rhomboid protease GluP
MSQVNINKKDEIVMRLIHYFVTKENYSPVLVQGTKDEIWLQNLEGPYKIIRINSNYIHNKEQYEFDLLKVKSVMNQIKKKTLSFKMNTLNIYVNSADRVEIETLKGIDSIVIKDMKEIQKNSELQDAFPRIEQKLIKEDNGLDLILNVSNEINNKTEKENKVYESIFKPKKTYFTYIIMGLCVLMFLLTYILGNGSEDIYTLLLFGANNLALVKAGQIYRLVACAFLHAGILHLLVNMYSLYIIGPQVESYIGKWKFLAIYLVSAISGSLMSLVFGTSVSVGASGAIFGLLGSLLYFGYHYRLYLSNALKTQIIPIIVLNLFIGFMSTNIDNGAHIGGLVGGYLVTVALGLDGKSNKAEKINAYIALLLYILIMCYVVFWVK